MKIEDDMAVFDDGTRVYCHAGTIGIDDELDITYGYDGGFGEYNSPLTKPQMRELADFMIKRWTEYRMLGENDAD